MVFRHLVYLALRPCVCVCVYVCVCVPTCVRAKTARVITFEQFKQAMTELAPKRFKGKGQEEALQLVYGLIAGKEPTNVGVTVSMSQSTQTHIITNPFTVQHD